MLMRTATQVARQPARQFPIWNGNGNTIADSIELMGARMPYARNVEIYGEGEPADYVYKVISGAVRITKLLDDGRRQVTAFPLPGEIFGLSICRARSSASSWARSTAFPRRRSPSRAFWSSSAAPCWRLRAATGKSRGSFGR